MDFRAFFEDVVAQNREKLQAYFREEAVIRWRCTDERFTVAEYIRANCEYPGRWRGEIERLLSSGDTAVLAGRVFQEEGGPSFHVVSLMRLKNGRISELDEYWADDGPPPAWRREMHIGQPIRKGENRCQPEETR